MAAEAKTFETREICSLLDVSTNELVHWAERGVAKPEVADAAGHGSRRKYSVWDVFKIAVVKRLAQAGLNLREVGLIIALLEEESIRTVNKPEHRRLLRRYKKARRADKDKACEELMSGFTMVVSFRQLVEQGQLKRRGGSQWFFLIRRNPEGDIVTSLESALSRNGASAVGYTMQREEKERDLWIVVNLSRIWRTVSDRLDTG